MPLCWQGFLYLIWIIVAFFFKRSFLGLAIKYRVEFLCASAFIGFLLSLGIDQLQKISFLALSQNLDKLFLPILALPTAFLLWYFRTYDVKTQISKTQESINNSSFFEAIKMLSEGLEDIKLLNIGKKTNGKISSSSIKGKVEDLVHNIQLLRITEDPNFFLSIKNELHDSNSNKEELQYQERELIEIARSNRSLILKSAIHEIGYLIRTGFNKERIRSITQELTLEHASLHSLDFSSFDLQGTQLSYSYLNNCSFKKANLKEARLEMSFFINSCLSDSDLKRAYLNHSALINADFTRANLTRAKLRYAILKDADLSGADLTDADLSGADLTDADLSGTNLTRAIYNSKTTLPEYINTNDYQMQKKDP